MKKYIIALYLLFLSINSFAQPASASDVARAFGAAPDPLISVKQSVTVNSTPIYDPYLAEEAYERRQERLQAKKMLRDYQGSVITAPDMVFLMSRTINQADSFLSLKKYNFYKSDKGAGFEYYCFAYKTDVESYDAVSYVTLRYEDSAKVISYQETNKKLIEAIKDAFVKAGFQYSKTVSEGNALYTFYVKDNLSLMIKTSVDPNNKPFYVANYRFDL